MAITVNTQQQLIEADRQFIDLINNRITVYGQIPYTVPERLIIDIIKESARYFYRHYWKATYKTFYFIAKEDILDHTNSNSEIQNISDYMITLPSFINVVYEIYHTNQTTMPTSQELLNNIQLLQRSAPYGQSVLGINNSLYIIEATCRMIEEQNYQSIFGTSVPFSYNNLVHKLSIHKNIITNLMVDCLVNVDIQFLYQDDLYIRHVIARTKQELKRLIASHTIELPGGVTLNADEICNNIEDVDKVEEILRNSGGIGDIIMMR